MKSKICSAGYVSILGAVVFVLTVLILQAVQPGYNPMHQLMSELALGQHGTAMIIAFSAFSVSVFGTQVELKKYAVPIPIRLLLMLAALSLLGAGIFRLDNALEFHVSLIAIAFILLGLTMYLLPTRPGALNSKYLKYVSWGLGGGAALGVTLGHFLVPMGGAQRFAALCILVWLLFVDTVTIGNIKRKNR